MSRVFCRLILCHYSRAPDGSSPRDCVLLLAMEDNLKSVYPVHCQSKNFLIRSVYRVRDSAPDGSSPRDCALLLAMEDNLKSFYPIYY